MFSFSDVYGHEIIISSLKKALVTGNHAHAYIFDGVSGIGKSKIADIFARALQCELNLKPCNECISCRASLAFNHPDIRYVKPKGAALGVDDIREQVNAAAHIRPYQYKYKVFILDSADKMTREAQNALLKTLEEPPSYAVFLLISQSLHNFLPTIISRCVTLRLKPLPLKQVEGYLTERGYDALESLAAASAGGGSIGKALLLVADEDFRAERKELVNILNNLPDSSLWDILLLARQLEKFKDNSARMLSFMQLWYRDALAYKATGQAAYFMQRDLGQGLETFSRGMSFKKLVAGANSIISAGQSLRFNGNYLLTMEIMLMKMSGF